MDWQPISTAPKVDGERILVWSGGQVSIAEWRQHFAQFADPECGSLMVGIMTPSHWMPLPEPPPEPEPAPEPEPIVMTVTLGLLMDAGNWTKACDLLGLNEWCMNEGLADRNTTQGLTRSQATALGFIR